LWRVYIWSTAVAAFRCFSVGGAQGWAFSMLNCAHWTFQNETQCHIRSFKSKDNMRMNPSKQTLKSIHIRMRIYTCLICVTCKRYIILYSGPGFLKANQLAGQGPGVSPPGHAHPLTPDPCSSLRLNVLHALLFLHLNLVCTVQCHSGDVR
jgi:hypothetical protein